MRHLSDLEYTLLMTDWISRPMRETLMQHIDACDRCRVRVALLVQEERDLTEPTTSISSLPESDRLGKLMKLIPRESRRVVYLYRKGQSGSALAAQPTRSIELVSPSGITALFETWNGATFVTVRGPGYWRSGTLAVGGIKVEIIAGEQTQLPRGVSVERIPNTVKLELGQSPK